ncbi:hypothetical protein HAX54_040510, partial [Datura stramonium]|nr:hypothetical protein [Datura stramonium]
CLNLTGVRIGGGTGHLLFGTHPWIGECSLFRVSEGRIRVRAIGRMIVIPRTVTVPLSKQNKSNTPALVFGDSKDHDAEPIWFILLV